MYLFLSYFCFLIFNYSRELWAQTVAYELQLKLKLKPRPEAGEQRAQNGTVARGAPPRSTTEHHSANKKTVNKHEKQK